MDGDAAQVAASGTLYVDGGSLELIFDTTPPSGTQFTLVTADKVGGEFTDVYSSIDVDLTYTATTVVATIK
jgi:hypothetical protein